MNVALRSDHRAELERSGISADVIREAGIRSVDHAEAYDFGFRNYGLDAAGMLIPFPDPATGAPSTRFALLKPDLCSNGAKYLSPVAETHRLHFAPGVTAADRKDMTLPIYFIEGVKKGLAVETWRRRDGRRGLVISISGCWGWRRKVKGPLPRDGALGTVGSEPIADLDLIEWTAREVFVCLDGDVMTNEKVAVAERALVRELKRRGAVVRVTRIPPAPDGSRRGADDFLLAEGDGAWSRLLDEAIDISKPKIKISLDVRRTVDQALDAIIEADAEIFQRAQSLVRVIRESGRPGAGIRRAEGAPIITGISDAGLLELSTDVADWIALRKAKEGLTETPALPPKHIRDALRDRKTWPGLPWLEGVIDAPTIRPDGSILDRPGYDLVTGLLYDPRGVAFPPVKDRPTKADAQAAMLDLAEPFAEFCFTDQNTGLAGCIAATLTLLGRAAIPGPCPMFAARSTTPGSGKGLIVDAICIIATGRAPARMAAQRGKDADTEGAKTILSVLLEGDPAILIDNAEGAFGYPSIAALLTANVFKGRLLGQSRTIEAPARAVWFLTGNGITFKGDLGRRVIPIDLDPAVEHPEDRIGPGTGKPWTHPALLTHVQEKRPALVSAGLTLLRAFHVAGRPGHGKPLKGSFEDWDRLIRAAVILAGAADPLDACETIREEGDADLDALRGALACWHEAFAGRALTAPEAVSTAKAHAYRETSPDPELLTALATLAGCEVAKLDGRGLGNVLKRVKGRPAGGLRFKREGKDRKAKIIKWAVEVCP